MGIYVNVCFVIISLLIIHLLVLVFAFFARPMWTSECCVIYAFASTYPVLVRESSTSGSQWACRLGLLGPMSGLSRSPLRKCFRTNLSHESMNIGYRYQRMHTKASIGQILPRSSGGVCVRCQAQSVHVIFSVTTL